MLWILLVGMGFLWIGMRIHFSRTNAWLLRANAMSTLTVLYAMAFLDVDGAIARYNIRRTSELASIDINYLKQLVVAALPALDELAERYVATASQMSDDHGLAQYCKRMKEVQRSREHLTARLETRWADWRGRTIRMMQIRDAHSNSPDLPTFIATVQSTRRRQHLTSGRVRGMVRPQSTRGGDSGGGDLDQLKVPPPVTLERNQ